jgi:hypothetical protein
MIFTLLAFAFAGVLFCGMLVFQDVGRRIGAKRLASDPGGAHAGAGVVEASVFGLLGLLLAFTFSGAASRFDERRHLITQEVNAIGSAWLRIDLLPPSTQPAMRDGFRRYLDARLAAYQSGRSLPTEGPKVAAAQEIQGELWANAAAICRTDSGERARLLLLPAMNAMFDTAEERILATRMHPPPVIYAMLSFLALVGSLLAGYEMAAGKTRNWILIVGFAATIAIAFYVILDLEYPRFGLIRVDQFDQALVELRATMQ